MFLCGRRKSHLLAQNAWIILHTCVTLFSLHTCASVDWWAQVELMSLYKTDGIQWNQLHSITHPYGPLCRCMTSLNPDTFSAILTLFWSQKHTLTLLWQYGVFIFEYIYLLSACACYPITKTPGMSLFHSSSQSEIENSIKGLYWRCSACLRGERQYPAMTVNGFFFPPQKPPSPIHPHVLHYVHSTSFLQTHFPHCLHRAGCDWWAWGHPHAASVPNRKA